MSYLDVGYNNLLAYEGRDAVEISDLATTESSDSTSSSSSTTASVGTESSTSVANSVTDTISPQQIDDGEVLSRLNFARDSWLKGGADDYNVGIGWWLGYRSAYNHYAFFIGDSAGDKMTYNPVDGLDITGTITAGTFIGGSIHIPDQNTTANSFHTNSSGNSWWGCTETLFTADNENANARILSTGYAKFKSGMIGGWTMTSSQLSATGIILDSTNQLIQVGSLAPYMNIDGLNKRIRTSTYTSGLQGFNIDADGSVEFNNITARGEFHSQVLSYGEIHATAGTSILSKSAGKLKNDCTTVTSPTTFNLDIDDPDTGHIQIFAVGDILEIKDGSGYDNWMTVGSVTDMTTYYRYVCTKNNGTNTTFRAGAAVVDYGPSGQGLIYSTADQTNNPYISIRTHTGSPWSLVTERVRLGNLTGITDAVFGALSGYGLWTNNIYLTGAINATSGRIGGSTNYWNIGAGLLEAVGSGDVAIRAGQSDYNTGTGFWLGLDSGVAKLSLGDGTPQNSLTWDGVELRVKGTPLFFQELFGDGSDGDVVISSDTSISRDMFYNNLTVNAGFILNTNGFRVHVKEILTVDGTIGRPGTVGGNGGNGGNGTSGSAGTGGTGGAAPAALSSGSIFGAIAGIAGGIGANGKRNVTASGNSGNVGLNGATLVKSITNLPGQNGVRGGGIEDGTSTGKATTGTGNIHASGNAGTGGTLGGAPTGTVYNRINTGLAAWTLHDFEPALDFLRGSASSGGSGGGAGSGITYSSPNTISSGGGGGGGASGTPGGISVIFAKKIIVGVLGVITCVGGNGGTGGNGGNVYLVPGATQSSAGGASGGGGGDGGDGGVLILCYSSLQNSGSVTVAGGAGGIGGSPGTGAGAGGFQGAYWGYWEGASGLTGLNGVSGTLIQLEV